MRSKKKYALAIYILVIIIFILLMIIVDITNKTVIVKMNITEVKGADYYYIYGNKAYIEVNGNEFEIDLVKKLNTNEPILAWLILITCCWAVVGIIWALSIDDK